MERVRELRGLLTSSGDQNATSPTNEDTHKTNLGLLTLISLRVPNQEPTLHARTPEEVTEFPLATSATQPPTASPARSSELFHNASRISEVQTSPIEEIHTQKILDDAVSAAPQTVQIASPLATSSRPTELKDQQDNIDNNEADGTVESSSVENHSSFTSLSASTPSTSQYSDPLTVYELAKSVFVSPQMEINSRDRKSWENKMKGRLLNSLNHKFQAARGSEPSLILEFMMAGPERYAASMRPTIILTCFHENNEKKLNKIMKKEDWLYEHSYPWVVVLDSFVTYSLGEHIEDERDVLVRVLVHPWTATLCGILAQADAGDNRSVAKFTIGGIITAGGKPYGLTVGHVLRRLVEQRASHNYAEDPNDSQSESENEGVSNPFLKFDASKRDRSSLSQRLVLPQAKNQEFARRTEPAYGEARGTRYHGDLAEEEEWNTILGEFILGRENPTALNLTRSVPTQNLDWALIDLRKSGLNPELYESNTIQLPGQEDPVEIMEVLRKPVATRSDVSINAGVSGVVQGRMTDCSVTLCFEQGAVELRQVIPDKPLGK